MVRPRRLSDPGGAQVGQYLNDAALEALAKYKYSGADNSLFYNYVSTHYLNFVVQRVFPPWLAPNLVTLMGFGCFLTGYTTIMAHCTVGECPDATPRWVFYAMALAMFLYQSFDNCDGKQARRTGTSSPLGEFFDHGVDALVVTLGCFVITTCTARSSFRGAFSHTHRPWR